MCRFSKRGGKLGRVIDPVIAMDQFIPRTGVARHSDSVLDGQAKARP
jgi:hypothetical protein